MPDINKAPPRKQGRWIKGMLGGEGYHCSECRVWKRVIATAHYCPNCGAEMIAGCARQRSECGR